MGLGQKHTHSKNLYFGGKNTLNYQIGRKVTSLPRMAINHDILQHGLLHEHRTSPLEKISKSSLKIV